MRIIELKGDETGFDGIEELLAAYRVSPADSLNGWKKNVSADYNLALAA